MVDNGDTIQGNFNHLFKNGPNPMVMGMNAIGYDVFSLGNHEFNYGMDNLNDVVSQANDNLDVLIFIKMVRGFMKDIQLGK